MAEKVLKENEVLIGEKKYIIVPVKMKYIKNKFYTSYNIIKKYGLIKLGDFTDCENVVENFLKGTFSLDEVPEELIDNIDAPTMKKLIEKVKEINEIEDETPKNEETPVKEQ